MERKEGACNYNVTTTNNTSPVKNCLPYPLCSVAVLVHEYYLNEMIRNSYTLNSLMLHESGHQTAQTTYKARLLNSAECKDGSGGKKHKDTAIQKTHENETQDEKQIYLIKRYNFSCSHVIYSNKSWVVISISWYLRLQNMNINTSVILLPQ